LDQRTTARAILGLGLFATAAAAGAQSTDWTPQLLPATETVRGPGDPIRLQLPTLPAGVTERLSLSIDGFDVTGFTNIDNDQLNISFPAPLSYGSHQLQLVEYAADGSIVERGVWTIEVRKSAALREAELNTDSSLLASYRIADHNLTAPAPSEAQFSGAAQMQGAVADGKWRIQGNVDFLYDSQAGGIGLQQRKFDVGRFLVRGSAGAFNVAAGHQDIGQGSLVLAGFNRRGVSVGLADEGARNSITAFALRTQDVIGFQNGLGIGDNGNRVDGIVVSGRPIPKIGDGLIVTATYLDGVGADQNGTIGSGIAGDPNSAGGDATSFLVQSNLLENRLRLSAEYARTNYDLGALVPGAAMQDGNAHAVTASFRPWDNLSVVGKPMVFEITVDHRRISSFFRSPANPQSIGDRKATHAATQLGWAGLQFSAAFGRTTDNVDDLANLERSESIERMAALSYTPTLNLQPSTDPNEPPALPWFGQPTLSANYSSVAQDVVKSSVAAPVGALQSTQEVSLNANFTYYSWSWSTGHALGKNDIYANFGDDTSIRRHNVQFNFNLGGNLNAGLLWQLAHTDNRSNANQDGDTVTAGANVGYAFNDKLYASVAYNFNRDTRDDNSSNMRSNDVVATLSWAAIQANAARPGLSISLDGQYHDVDDRIGLALSQDLYQVFLKATLNWQPRL